MTGLALIADGPGSVGSTVTSLLAVGAFAAGRTMPFIRSVMELPEEVRATAPGMGRPLLASTRMPKAAASGSSITTSPRRPSLGTSTATSVCRPKPCEVKIAS